MSEAGGADARRVQVAPATLEALGSIGLRARAVVDGMIAGTHRSPSRGSSVEFAEYKEYAPGDDLRHIDWRAYGRIDRYFVKQFEDETNLRAYLVLDASGSMDFGHDDAPTKRLFASTLLAALALVLLRQGDAPGLLTFSGSPGVLLPPSTRRRQFEDICAVLEATPAAGTTDLDAALQHVAERVPPRSLVVLASDLLTTTDGMLMAARILRRRGMEVVVFHVLDRAELTLPYEGLTLFEGLEHDGDLLVEPDDIRDAYQRAMDHHREAAAAGLAASDVEYFLATTDAPVEAPLRAFLESRQRRR